MWPFISKERKALRELLSNCLIEEQPHSIYRFTDDNVDLYMYWFINWERRLIVNLDLEHESTINSLSVADLKPDQLRLVEVEARRCIQNLLEKKRGNALTASRQLLHNMLFSKEEDPLT